VGRSIGRVVAWWGGVPGALPCTSQYGLGVKPADQGLHTRSNDPSVSPLHYEQSKVCGMRQPRGVKSELGSHHRGLFRSVTASAGYTIADIHKSQRHPPPLCFPARNVRRGLLQPLVPVAHLVRGTHITHHAPRTTRSTTRTRKHLASARPGANARGVLSGSPLRVNAGESQREVAL
jgi:hypothetical protein